MVKKLSAFAVAVLFAAVFSLSASSVEAKTIDLNLSLLIPSTHLRYIHVFEPWIKKIQERTGGQVKITPYFSGALSSFPEAFDAAATGVTDMSEGITREVRGRFNLIELLAIPGLQLETGYNYSRAMWHLYKTMPEIKAECKGVKVLWLYASPPARLLTRNKPVRSVEDLKGMKIRMVGPTPVETGKALGFAPVSVNSGELYMALEKGVLDGAVIPLETLVARRLQEVVKYVTNYDMGATLFFMVMNQDAYNQLPKDVKKVLDELTGDWAVEFGSKAWDDFDNKAIEASKQKGVQYIDLAPEEAKRWRDMLAPAKEAYAAQLEAKGLPGKRLLSEVEKLRLEYVK